MARYWSMVPCVLFVLMLCGCASPLALTYNESAKQTINFRDTKSYVYFYRPPSAAAKAVGILVSANGEYVGALNEGTYFIHEATPGRHRFVLQREAAALELDLAPGKKYFIATFIKPGFLAPRFGLERKNGISETDMASYKQVLSVDQNEAYWAGTRPVRGTYAFIVRKFLEQNFLDGPGIFNWLVERKFAEKVSGGICRVPASADLKELRLQARARFPLEGDGLVNLIEKTFYNEYIRTKLFYGLARRCLAKSFGVRIELNISERGDLSLTSALPLSHNTTSEDLKRVETFMQRVSPILPPPECVMEVYNGHLTQKLLRDHLLKMGAPIFDWLLRNNFIEMVSENRFQPLPLTAQHKAELYKAYPDYAEQVERILTRPNKGASFRIVIIARGG